VRRDRGKGGRGVKGGIEGREKRKYEGRERGRERVVEKG
jgi:hypothetical protein